MKKQSVDILDDAERFEDILNWQLFKIEQDQMLWGARMEYSDDWYPGFPMYERPIKHGWGQFFALNGRVGHPRYQWVRPMFELFDENDSLGTHDSGDFYLNRLCETCCVKWEGPAGCWVCGEGEMEYEYSLKSLGQQTLVDYDIDYNEYIFRFEATGSFAAGMRAAVREQMDRMLFVATDVNETLSMFGRDVSRRVESGLTAMRVYLDEYVTEHTQEDILVNGIRIPRDVVLDAVAETPLPDPPFPPFRAPERIDAFWLYGLDSNRRRNRD